MNPKTKINGWLIMVLVLFTNCDNDYIPKPRGYFRIEMPIPQYQVYNRDCPFEFKYNTISKVTTSQTKLAQPCWLNLDYLDHKATVHLSYAKIDNNIEQLLEDSRSLAYKHTVKATEINESIIVNDTDHVYGLIYELEGDAASSAQFYLTDSVNHFVRGALYFNVIPNPDSLAPVTQYIKQDIWQFIGSFKWK